MLIQKRTPCPFTCSAGRIMHGWIEITGKCNLRCHYCYTDSTQKIPDILTTDEIKRIIDDFSRLGADTLVLSGGEPCLRLDLPELMVYSSKRIPTKLVSNGTILDENVAQILSDMKIDVQLSIDSINPEIYRKSRGVSLLGKVLKNIDKLLDYGVEITLATTITEITKDHIFDVLQFAIEKNICNIHVGTLIPEGRGKETKHITAQSLDTLLNRLYEFQKSNFEVISIDIIEDLIYPIVLHKPRKFYCNAMEGKALEISFDGCVYICGGMREYAPMYLGNVKNEDLEEIYHRALSANKFIRISVDDIPTCRHCEYKYICAGGCRATSYQTFGGIYSKGYWCESFKAIIHDILRDVESGELDDYFHFLEEQLKYSGIEKKKIF